MSKFPCTFCKGKGGYKEPILEDGSGPYYPCDACADTGFIGVGDTTHLAMLRQKIMDALFKEAFPGKGWDEYCLDAEDEQLVDDTLTDVVKHIRDKAHN